MSGAAIAITPSCVEKRDDFVTAMTESGAPFTTTIGLGQIASETLKKLLLDVIGAVNCKSATTTEIGDECEKRRRIQIKRDVVVGKVREDHVGQK